MSNRKPVSISLTSSGNNKDANKKRKHSPDKEVQTKQNKNHKVENKSDKSGDEDRRTATSNIIKTEAKNPKLHQRICQYLTENKDKVTILDDFRFLIFCEFFVIFGKLYVFSLSAIH